jgi:hypothetical protein
MDLKEAAKKLIIDRYTIDPVIFEVFVTEGLTDEKKCRDFLIRSEAAELRLNLNQTEVKATIAEKYNVSYSTAEKIILKKIE